MKELYGKVREMMRMVFKVVLVDSGTYIIKLILPPSAIRSLTLTIYYIFIKRVRKMTGTPNGGQREYNIPKME